MDPCLWSRLPEHLLVHVFARLPMPQIFSLGGLSNGWSATSKTSSFKRICAEAHSKTFGILGYRRSSEQFQVAAFDLKNHKWVYHELTHLPREYRKAAWHRRGAVHKEGALYSHDGGLVCFVSTKNLPILVCNPLTNEWKTLPPNDFSRKQPVMVQLVTVAETGGYRVMVVCRHGGIRVPDIKSSPGVSISETAEAYDSKTGLWSRMNTGYVHGLDHTEYNLPKVFDCKSKALVTLSNRSQPRTLYIKRISSVSPLICFSLQYRFSHFVQHKSYVNVQQCLSSFRILEAACASLSIGLED